MFIAMNRFKIMLGEEEAFERVWAERDSHLKTVPGFKDFKLLRGPEGEEYTLFASHTVWENEEAFIQWTRSEAFRAAHANAGDNRKLYLGHPQFEGFSVVLSHP